MAIALVIATKFKTIAMANPINQLFGIHAQALSLRAARSEVIATNLANSDTPHYKARDIDFKSALQGLQKGQLQNSIHLAKSNSHHIDNNTNVIPAQALRYRVPSHASLDGNTVDADYEKSAFTENAIRYQASLSFLSKKISGMIRTLRGE